MEDYKQEMKRIFSEKISRNIFIPGESSVPVSGKKYDEHEILSMVEAVMDGWWTEGRFAKEFESKLCGFLGRKYCQIVNSGSSANLLAISALTSSRLKNRRLKKGDEVITAAAGFPTTINPIIQNGLVPVFVDTQIGTYNPSLIDIEKAISKKTKAIFLAHTLGNPFDVEGVMRLAKKHKLWVIEDNCDALGSKFNGKYTGTFGHISTFSFYPAHHITMGEGGALTTDNPLLDKIIRSMRDWGRDCWCGTGQDNSCKNRFGWKLGKLPQGYDHKYIYSEIGYNLKVTDIQAALGCAQMDKLEDFIRQRKENFEYLYEGMQDLGKYFILPQWHKKSDVSWFGFPITIKKEAKFSRVDLLKYLDQKKIGTRLLFAGNITKQPYFINYKIKYRILGHMKGADDVMNNTLWIGVCPSIDRKMLEYVIDSIISFVKIY
jgi:CDP-6-deoxy-D-xylo-4-hexulose-3-dehydrase